MRAARARDCTAQMLFFEPLMLYVIIFTGVLLRKIPVWSRVFLSRCVCSSGVCAGCPLFLFLLCSCHLSLCVYCILFGGLPVALLPLYKKKRVELGDSTAKWWVVFVGVTPC